MSKDEVNALDYAKEAAQELMKASIGNIVTGAQSVSAPVMFPHGINSLNIQVTIPNVLQVGLIVSGPEKAAAIPVFGSPADRPLSVPESCEANWEANKSDCSGFVKAVAMDFGVTLNGDADAIVAHIIKDTANWKTLASGSEAEDKAKDGMLVVAGLKGSDHKPSRNNGHVVIVVEGTPLASGKYPFAWWGSLGGVGKKNTTLNYSWTAADRDKIHYRYHTI